MNFSSTNVTVVHNRDSFNKAVTKNVIVVVLGISINYINATLVHTFNKHQVWYYSEVILVIIMNTSPLLADILRSNASLPFPLLTSSLFSCPLHSSSILQVYPHGFSLEPASEAVIFEKLNCSKVTMDSIPARFLRVTVESITPCVTWIINLSIKQGQFSFDPKLKRVIPPFKRENKLDQKNYRPPSILWVLPKITEKNHFE